MHQKKEKRKKKKEHGDRGDLTTTPRGHPFTWKR
jgi:hypothetical protein